MFVYFLTIYIYIYIYSFYRYFYLKMAGKNTGVSTRSKDAIKFSVLCFQKAKQINEKHLPAALTKFWKEKLDTLFDISSCSCNLPIVSCDNINVKCTKENCQTKHIICSCPLTQKVSYFLFLFSNLL